MVASFQGSHGECHVSQSIVECSYQCCARVIGFRGRYLYAIGSILCGGGPAALLGGFYLGVNGGYGGNSGLTFREDVFFPGAPSSGHRIVNPYSVVTGTDTIAGGFGGGQLGYNFQFGSWVVGAEADIQGSDIQGSGANAIFNPHLAAGSALCRNTTTGA